MQWDLPRNDANERTVLAEGCSFCKDPADSAAGRKTLPLQQGMKSVSLKVNTHTAAGMNRKQRPRSRYSV
ncbi:hypothetical protein CEF21_12050 [Bacillus sp. FJAT-42376]|nr:hypothetical protein CEF21_12050 [Bacillus sp. FJAT-42376]